MTITELYTSVFDQWAEGMSDTKIGTNVSADPLSTLKKLPYATMSLVSAIDTGHDLDNAASGCNMMVQTDIYVDVDTRISESMVLDEKSNEIMSSLGFRRETALSLDYDLSGVKRIISRYNRIVGYGEFI